MLFYILRQNFANAQRDFTQPKNFDARQLNDKTPPSFSEIIQKSSSDIAADIVSNLSWIVNQSQKKYNTTFDIQSDSSFQKYLSDDNPFSDSSYKPIDLAPIVSHFTYNKSSKFLLRSSAGTAFADMARAFQEHFDKSHKFYLVSAYRSYGLQNSLLKNGCKESRCAEPWSSEHQAWLAVDISVANRNWKTTQMTTWSDYYQWMAQNAHKYWFHNTYQKWEAIDWKMAEHRHRRFVWIPFATYLYENNLTIAEYFKTNN